MFLLLIITFIEFITALLFCKGDFFRPGILLSLVMLCSVISATYLSSVWKFELTPTVIIAFSLAILIVIFVDQVVSLSLTGYKNHIRIELTEIKTYYGIDLIVIALGVVAIIWHFNYLRSTFGSGSWFVMATQYRNSIVWESLETAMPSGLSRLIDWIMIFGYVYTYIVVNNIIVHVEKKRLIVKIIPVILYCVDSLLTGARGYIIYLAIAAVTYLYVLVQRKNGWIIHIGYKYIKKIVGAFIILAVLFFFMGNMFGKSEGSIVYNISVYLGGGIGLFNDYVEKGGIATPGFGVVTFVALYKFLKQFGFPDYTNYFQFEFRYDWGNIYTAIRRYYQDFGMIGVIVCMTVFAIFFSYFYSVIKKDNKPHIIDLRLLIYGMMVRSICLFFADDELFVDFCTPTFIKTIIKFWIVSYLLTNVSITKNGIKLKRNQRNYVR